MTDNNFGIGERERDYTKIKMKNIIKATEESLCIKCKSVATIKGITRHGDSCLLCTDCAMEFEQDGQLQKLFYLLA